MRSGQDNPAEHARIEGVVRSAQAGSQDAFAELYRLFFPMVHGILLARLPFPDAQDGAQEVFLQAWRNLPSLREVGAFGGWVGRIAHRFVADHYRALHPADELPANLQSKPGDEEAWFLLQSIRSLPEAYRETMMLRFVEGLTGPEIALVTGLTPDSVRVNLHRGVKLLREQLKGVAAR